MAKNNLSERKFKGKNPFFSGGALIAFAFFVYVAFTADWAALKSMGSLSSSIIVVALMVAIPVIIFFRTFFGGVYIGRNSQVYHSRPGCAGANQKINRMRAKTQGLQPCAKCHKIAGMGR